MSISILNRGASGGLKPELTVTAPAGSTIDLLRNGVVVDTYTLGAGETEHTFVVKLGTYTVQGTLGEDTKSEEVLIDVVGQYTVALSYEPNYVMLYDYGDECTDITGGWAIKKYSSSSYTFTKNENNIYFGSSTKDSSPYAGTANKISMDGIVMLASFADEQNSSKSYSRFGVITSFSSGETLTSIYYQEGTSLITSVAASDLDDGFIFLHGNMYDVTSASYQWWVRMYALWMCKADMWEKLCTKAGISAPTDLPTLIADTTSITAILANEDAVKYMVANCTGDFMTSFMQSSACRSALDVSPYKALVTENEHWAKFLAMVQ